MDKLLHNVGKLPGPTRSAVENLVGHALQDDQNLYIVALNATKEPSITERQAAWSELEAIIAEAKDNVRQTAEPAESLDQVIDEACNDARYGKQ